MSKHKFEGRRILLIDDDPSILAVVREGLQKQGCEVTEADRGGVGVARAREGAFDLIVLDIVLPDRNGFDVCRDLKGDPQTGSIPVIFLSAKEEPKERVRGLRLGAVDYVLKPFDLDELLERIDIALRLKASAVSSPPSTPTDEDDEDTQTRAPSLMSEAEFKKRVEDRVRKLDPEYGLLTLALIRVDQTQTFSGKESEELRSSVLGQVASFLSDLVPKETVLGKYQTLQIGVLFPRKNKYGVELVLDDLKKRLASFPFRKEDREVEVTLSCGVAEFPNVNIKNGRELLETAAAALKRAIRRGGDQAVLL